METLDMVTIAIATSMGAAWASGINLYATVLMLGFLNMNGAIDLPPDLDILSDPMVLGAAGFMYCVEFFADKIPGVDSGWDGIHTFIRIPAGALLAANGMAEVGPAAELAAALVGGSLAATSHFTKAGGRVLINTSPEPFTNWTASLGEDVLAVAGIYTAMNYPIAFLVLLAIFVTVAIWLLPKLWRGIKRVFAFIGNLLSGQPRSVTPPPPQS